MEKKTALAVSIVAAAAILSGCGQHTSADASTASNSAQPPASGTPATQDSAATPPAPPVQPAPPSFVTVAAQQLYGDYHANEVLADTKYKGRWLYVRGTVSEIGKDFNDDPYVNLVASDNEFENVRANFAKAAIPTLATLHKGEGVSLMCFGKGMIVGSPILDCTRDGAPPMPTSAPPTAEQSHQSATPNAGDDAQAPASNQQQAAAQTSQGDGASMWIGNLDMNLRSCPGTTCSALIVIPKHARVDVDPGSIRNVTESSGTETPWAQVTYSGPYCDPMAMDQKFGCVTLHEPGNPVTGWVNYQRLSPIPADQQTATQ